MSIPISVDQLPDRLIRYNEQDYLFFSGTAYLGIPQHPIMQQQLAEAIRQYGTVFGSSRNGNLRLTIYEEAEAQLAAMVGTVGNHPQAALTLSSGMLAGQVVVQWLQQQSMHLLYAPGTHPALWNGPATSLPRTSFSDWRQHVAEQIRALNPAQPIAILTNSVDAVRSEHYAFDWVDELPDDRLITLVIDDSHGLGLLNGGRGIWSQLPQRDNVRVLVTGSLAKAMGLPGGVVLGETDMLQQVRKTPFFGACSPIPPAYLAAFVKTRSLYETQYNRLRQLVDKASEVLLPTGLFQQVDGYPVFYTEQEALYPFLLQHNILIYSFAYPTPSDRTNTRIVISAFHELTDIQALAKNVSQYNCTA